MGIRKKEGENLSDTQLEKVFNLLSTITKKKACELLNISYNTTRLNKIMQGYSDRRDFSIERKKKLRNTPLSDDEISYIISSYLEEVSMAEISERVFRSLGIIKRTLQKYKIPLRTSKISFTNPIFLEENTISESYEPDDLVYSAKYNQPAKISKFITKNEIGSTYRLWLLHDMQYVYQHHYELADLTQVQKKFKIDIIDMKWVEDIKPMIDKTLIEARKSKRK